MKGATDAPLTMELEMLPFLMSSLLFNVSLNAFYFQIELSNQTGICLPSPFSIREVPHPMIFDDIIKELHVLNYCKLIFRIYM